MLMAGETSLVKLLADPKPKLRPGEYVFCSLPSLEYGERADLKPIASYQEDEGLSLLLEKHKADEAGFQYHCVLRGITLSVNSSIEAVGFTAEISRKLAEFGIPANVVAAHHHDHIFVPADQAEAALKLLKGEAGV